MRDARTGDWLVFHVGAGANDTRPCADPASDACGFVRNCSGGCTGPEHPWESGLSFYGPASVLRSASPLGPWEDRVIGACDAVPGCAKNATYRGNGNDLNPAPVQLGQGQGQGQGQQAGPGEVLMLWRSIDYSSKGQSYYARATAPVWSGPYTWSTTNLFPGFADCHIEDGHVYRTRRGVHALFHSDCEGVSGGAAGGHAFSADGGLTWTLHPRNAYNRTVALRGGGAWQLSRRERPKLITGADGEITHLINGVSLPGQCDHTFTLVTPIASASS